MLKLLMTGILFVAGAISLPSIAESQGLITGSTTWGTVLNLKPSPAVALSELGGNHSVILLKSPNCCLKGQKEATTGKQCRLA
jgi:hypothetical protein